MRRQRLIVRWIHLVVAVALGFLVYLPPSTSTGLRAVLMLVGVPLAAASGLYLWQQARIRRLRDRWSARQPEHSAARQ